MSGLTLSHVTKEFGTFKAVNNVSLSVPDGTFVCLLGPSGCGKTTLMRMVAGLDLPTEGSITLGGEDITRVPTHKRNLGMVFQSLALFPHLTVGENIAYALRIRGVSKDEQKKRVDELLSMIHLPGFSDRSVNKLSGASVSGLRSPAPWPSRQSSSCSMSRYPHSMRNCARPCRSNCVSCSSVSASPRSS
jgi:putative spermidine/putrescine transport system ATP-binding protein